MIDKKGRVFGKINIIDLMVIVLIVCVVLIVLFKTFSNKKAETASNTDGIVTMTLEVFNTVSEAKDYINEGDKLIISSNITSLEVVSARFEKAKEISVSDAGGVVFKDSDLFSNVYVVIKSKGINTDKGIMAGGIYLRVNQSFEMVTDKFSGVGKIVGLEFENIDS